MRFAFLGYSGAVQLENSDNASFLMERNGAGFLVDVSGGPVGKLKELGFDPLNLDAVLLTHQHIDHLYGLPSLLHQLWLMGRTRPITILGLPETLVTARNLITIFALADKKGIFPIQFSEIRIGESYSWQDLSLRWVAMDHGVPTSGFQLHLNDEPQLFYSADTRYCPDLGVKLKGTKVVVHESATLIDQGEATRSKGHSTAEEAGRFAVDVGAETLYLFHFDHAYEHRMDEFSKEAATIFTGTILLPRPLKWYTIG